MSLWDTIIADRDDVLLNPEDGMTCTAIQLPGGQSFTGIYADTDSQPDKEFGIANVIRGKLWIPLSEQIEQRSTWRVTLQSGSTFDATGMCHGEQSGGLVCVHLERVKVSKFNGVTAGSLR